MSRRIAPLAAVVAFALAVALVAAMAGQGGQDLVKLPVGAVGGGQAEDAAASTASRLAYPEFGPVEYRVDGALPDLPTTAPAYRLGSDATRADVRRLAGALGLDGEVREVDQAWVVRSGQRELRVERVPGQPWYLGQTCPDAAVSSDTAGVTVACASGVASTGGGWAPHPGPMCKDGTEDCIQPAPAAVEVAPAPAADRPAIARACRVDDAGCTPKSPAVAPAPVPPFPTTTVVCPPDAGCKTSEPCPPGAACTLPEPYPMPTPPEKPVRPADLPSRQEAERLARDAFARLGVSLDGFALEDGWLTWEARVEQRLDGRPVLGFGSSLSIGAKGAIERANGYLAAPDRIGDYPLVGVEAGIERLRTNVGIGPSPLVANDGAPFPAGAEPAVLPADDPAVDSGHAGGIAGPESTVEPGTSPVPDECAKPTVICDPPPGDPVGPPDTAPPVPEPEPAPVVRTITGARLALLQVDALLVPVYIFQLDGGDEETFPVPAVTDEWLQQEIPAKRD